MNSRIGDGGSTPDDFKEVVLEALMVAALHRADHDTDPRRALADLIAWEVSIALDPLVSSEANALILRGRAECQSFRRKPAMVLQSESPGEMFGA